MIAEGTSSDTVNIETICDLSNKFNEISLGFNLAENVPGFRQSSIKVSQHRSRELDFRVNKVTPELVAPVLEFFSSRGLVARLVPQKVVVFAFSIPKHLDEVGALKIFKHFLNCPDLTLTLWTRDKRETDKSNGCAKLFFPAESFKACPNDFLEKINSADVYELQLPNLRPIKLRKWIDRQNLKKNNSRSYSSVASAPSSRVLSSSSLSSKEDASNDAFNARMKQFNDKVQANASSISEMTTVLEQNNKRLKNFETSILSVVNKVDQNSDHIRLVVKSQTDSDKKLEIIMKELAQLNSRLFSNKQKNNNNPQPLSILLAGGSAAHMCNSPSQFNKAFAPYEEQGKPPRAPKSSKTSMQMLNINVAPP